MTSCFLPDKAPLALAIRDAIARGETLEGCFSRNRSFAHKLKRYDGEFVPRGQTLEEARLARRVADGMTDDGPKLHQIDSAM